MHRFQATRSTSCADIILRLLVFLTPIIENFIFKVVLGRMS